MMSITSSLGVVVVPSIILSYSLAYVFKQSGVHIPGVGSIDLWGVLVNNHPQSLKSLAYEHYIVWFVFYFTSHFLLYVKPHRSLFHPFKLNPNYPSVTLVLKEMARSARGVAICTLYATVVNQLYRSGTLPSRYVPPLFDNDGDVSLGIHMVGGILIYLWADLHFYWTHRLLHTSMLYKSVHKVHHESYNPDPFSGLSMHWVESAVYFSSAPIMAIFTPLYMFRFLSIGLIVNPLEGHWGFGDWSNEGSIAHYIHHSKFNWNYSGTPAYPIWDHIMGTNYTELGGDKNRDQETRASEQAAIVKCPADMSFYKNE